MLLLNPQTANEGQLGYRHKPPCTFLSATTRL